MELGLLKWIVQVKKQAPLIFLQYQAKKHHLDGSTELIIILGDLKCVGRIGNPLPQATSRSPDPLGLNNKLQLDLHIEVLYYIKL